MIFWTLALFLPCFVAIVHGLLPLIDSHGFGRWRTRCDESIPRTIRQQSKLKNDDGEFKRGYKFGDVSRLLAKRVTSKVNELTGKDSYEFGDLSRWLDGRAKERVQAIKGQQGDYKYEFGDLTRWADALAKEKAANFAGKETSQDYEFGDISLTVIRKVRSGEYNLEDVYLAFRLLATAGFSLSPVVNLLPVQGLLQLVNLGLAKDVGGRLMGVLATALDARMKEALTGNASYELGDMTKDRLREALARFTGKDTYEFGDIFRTIVERRRGDDVTKESNGSSDDAIVFTLQDQLGDDLAKWDAKFLELEGVASDNSSDDFAKWDAKFQEQQGNRLSK